MNPYIKYFLYLCKHKWYVWQECKTMGLYWRGIMHDMSKFLPDEFIPYARYFNIDHDKYQVDFDKAWLKHQHRNPHHWQHWILREDSGNLKVMQIPYDYLIEMYCDWVGAGKSITGKNNIVKWYDENKTKIILQDSMRSVIEEFINYEREIEKVFE